MKTRFGMTAMTLLAASAVTGAARADEEKIPLDKVPAAVMKAVKAKFPKGEIKGAAKEVEEGKTTYEVTLTDAGRNVDVGLSEDGTILEVEKEMPVADLPKAVSDAVKGKYPNGTFKKAEEVTKGEKKTYEVVVAIGGKSRELVLDPDGKILEDEDA